MPLAQALVFSWLSLLSTSTSRSSLKNRVKWAVWVRCCFNKFFVLIYTKFITTSYVWCFIAMACTTVSKVGICIYHLTHFVFSSLRRMKVLRIHRKKQKFIVSNPKNTKNDPIKIEYNFVFLWLIRGFLYILQRSFIRTSDYLA